MQVHEHEAVARGDNLPISHKHATEVGRFIKGDTVETARRKLEQVIDKDQPVPYKRFNSEQAHKHGDMDAGRYPVKTAKEILTLLNSAESNAVHEGLPEEDLVVTGFMANQGSRYQTPKRHRGRKPKAANITLKVGEKG
jgi:large subunit ribosomal protein L22